MVPSYIRFLKDEPVNRWDQKRRVMRRYDVTAPSYDVQYGEEQEAKYRKALEHAKLAGGVVLDVGCGTGLLFSHVAHEAQIVVGVDISRGLLLHAKEASKKFRNIHLVRADADHLPFRNAFFSVVFAFTVLQNMPKPMETLEAIRQTAKSDAVIVVTGLKKTFSAEAFTRLLERAGLRVVSMDADDVLKCYVAVATQS
jgi:ubiquinone/menaquinone biosynthesis C-methylase UbiE